MPVALTFPGVYIEEVASGVRTITTVSTSITAFVGYTARGPVDRAVRLKNFGDFERTFGGLARDSEVSYAVQQFFLNGGADAYVVRVAQGASAASATLKFGSGAGDNALVADAASPGIWGNDVRIDVDYNTSNPDSTFNLTVIRSEVQRNVRVDVERESYLNLSMNSHSPSYAPSVVNASSKLIKLTRPAGITFADRGTSLSGSLATLPTLLATDTTLQLILDGVDAVTLTLTNPAGVTDVAGLVTALTAAIATAGQAARLLVERVDSLGVVAAAGNFVKLTSQNVVANPNTAPEFSSVQVVSAAAGDVAPKLRLGRSNGGREKEGAATRRVLPTGTTSADLTDILGTNVAGAVTVTVNDNSSGAPVVLVTQAQALPAGTAVGEPLRAELQTLIRAIPNPATQNASVRLEGTRLHITPSASTPNASIVFAGAGATAARLTGAGSSVNVQSYNLGVGATFGGQVNPVVGNDGSPPSSANTIIGSRATKTGIYALLDVDIFNLLAIPYTTKLSDSAARAVIAEAIALCVERRAFYLLDPDPLRVQSNVAAWADLIDANKNAAVYFPQILAADPLDGFRLKPMPASGAIAGVYARTDSERGVWKAPAGTEAIVRGAQGLNYTLTDPENGDLNPVRVNTLRTFPVFGTVVWGARTLAGADVNASEWKYIPVRRTALFIEESLYRGLKWVVFEPNDEPLWAQIRLNVGAFMQDLFRQGAFQGRTPREAYFVKCDRETTTQNDINRGIVNILVGFAPLKPAEFVVLILQQIAGQVQV